MECTKPTTTNKAAGNYFVLLLVACCLFLVVVACCFVGWDEDRSRDRSNVGQQKGTHLGHRRPERSVWKWPPLDQCQCFTLPVSSLFQQHKKHYMNNSIIRKIGVVVVWLSFELFEESVVSRQSSLSWIAKINIISTVSRGLSYSSLGQDVRDTFKLEEGGREAPCQPAAFSCRRRPATGHTHRGNLYMLFLL